MIKWDHFEILATGQSDIHCKIKETLLIRDLKPALNENVGSEKSVLYYPFIFFQHISLGLFIVTIYVFIVDYLPCLVLG